MNQVYVCCSTFHIYISILEAYKYKKMGHESILIFIIDKINDAENLIPVLKNIEVFDDIVPIKGYSITDRMKKKIGFFNYMFNRAQSLVNLFEEENPELVKYKDFIEHSELNLFEVNRTRAYFIIKYPKIFMRMHEDGYGAYSQKLSPIRIFNRKYITRFPLLKGHDEEVKEFKVQHPEKIFDKALKSKAKKMDLDALQDALSKEEKNKIVSSFLGENTIEESHNRALIVTQPLSEIGKMSEQKKVDIYSSMVEDAKTSGFNVYLKMHPRELTDYKSIFGNTIKMIPKLFPLEIFNLSSDFSFKKGYTISSTALGNLKYVEKKFFFDKTGEKVYN